MDKNLIKKIEDEHIIFITSGLRFETTSEIILKLKKWNYENPNEEIKIYLASSNFDFTNTISIFDYLENIDNPVSIFCIGLVGGYSTLFLGLPKNIKRYALKHTEFSLNEPLGFLNSSNQQTEVEIIAKDVTRIKNKFESILSAKLNKSIEELHQDIVSNKKMSAKEALEYGLIDYILE